MLRLCAEKAQPFDFLINGELVRSSLEHILLANKISAVGQISHCCSLFASLVQSSAQAVAATGQSAELPCLSLICGPALGLLKLLRAESCFDAQECITGTFLTR